jgi:hypothetical protein
LERRALEVTPPNGLSSALSSVVALLVPVAILVGVGAESASTADPRVWSGDGTGVTGVAGSCCERHFFLRPSW